MQMVSTPLVYSRKVWETDTATKHSLVPREPHWFCLKKSRFNKQPCRKFSCYPAAFGTVRITHETNANI